MSRRAKVILIAAIITLAVIGLCLAVILNIDKIYVFVEELGWFREEVEIVKTERNDLVAVPLDELENMQNVTLDQSLMLINKQNHLPDDFVPRISEYKDTAVFMNDCMLSAYESFSAAVKANTGNKLYVSSDFRTADEQAALYDADPLTATEVGASEHQSGLALDVYVARYAGDAFIKSPSGRFVNSRSWEYGFIIRYPSYAEDITGIRYEPWHIRYVGHPHADVIYNNHITLEEYIDSFELGAWYEIDGYLVSRQSALDGHVFLPNEFSLCTISPDNTGAYIITVRK
jgi:D-alanyl-D-alanine carboxypeptidase